MPLQAEQLFLDFVDQSLNLHGETFQPELYGSYLYQVPTQCPEMSGLRLLHPGRWLGSLKTHRFEPAHALALGLRQNQVQQVINLNLEDRRLLAYLRGEQIPGASENGWCVILVDGYPLGWGKCARRVVKNFYPKGLRWL